MYELVCVLLCTICIASIRLYFCPELGILPADYVVALGPNDNAYDTSQLQVIQAARLRLDK